MLTLCLLILTLLPQEPTRPLPELAPFLAEFRKTLQTDDKRLSEYTYTETETEITLDGKGKAKKSETNVYQVINGPEEWQSYRRQTIRKGVAVTEKELEKKDREHEKQVEKVKEKRAKEPEARRLEAKAKEDREDQKILDELFAVYEIKMVRREVLDDRDTILMTFKPRPATVKTREGKIIQHLWQSMGFEDDHELARWKWNHRYHFIRRRFGGVKPGSTLAFDAAKSTTKSGFRYAAKWWSMRAFVLRG
jgi:hypothetical protein